ncbi:hypothetical protein Esti_000052 [Eimeria stiedai]
MMTCASEITSQQTLSELPVCHGKVAGQQPHRSGSQIHSAAVPYAQGFGYVVPDSQIASDMRGALGGKIRGGGPLSHPAARAAAQPLKKMAELSTNAAVPKGYLRYWARHFDQEAAEIPESEEFESAYAMKAQSLFPFRSTTTEWTVNTAGGFLVMMMPWGPIMMLIGLLIGGLLGFGLAMANDMCRLRKKSCAATEQKKKIDHLIRWAGYHFASSSAQLQLVFKVIMEYEVLARLGDISKTARSQLRLLYAFLSRGDVGHCLWLYLDYFEAHYEQMTRREISMCALVCLVSTQCALTLRKTNNPPVVMRMMSMMTDPEVKRIFQKSKTPTSRQTKLDERTERCLFYADNSQGVQTYVMKGGDLLQSLHKDRPSLRMTFSSEEDSFRDAVSEFDAGSSASYKANPKEENNQDSLPGNLRPVENFNVALTYNASVERVAPWTLEGSCSSAAVTTTDRLSIPACTAGKQQPLKSCIAINGPKGMSTAVARQQVEPIEAAATCGKATKQTRADTFRNMRLPGRNSAEPARLFESYEDLINFDRTLKHQTPIGAYEFQFLDEREKHDPHDPSWELTVNQPLIKVYKYISPNSPVVIVKAYASFDGIPLSVLSHNIKNISSRLEWDTTFDDYRIIEKDVNGCEMIYCMMKAPFPVSNRDFLQWSRLVREVCGCRSADHPSVPERQGCVRAETLMSGYLMRRSKDDPNSSTLFLVAQTDVKGLIPKWLVNTTAARAPVGWVENLRRACKKHMEKRCIP